MHSRSNLQAPVLFRGIAQRQPDGHLQDVVRLRGGKNGVLMPSGHIGIALAGLVRGQLGANVGYGIAGDFRADKAFDRVQEMAVAQELEGAAPPGGADVEAVVGMVGLFVLVGDTGKALLKRFVFEQPVYQALPMQFMSDLVDDGGVVIDNRLQVVIRQGAFNNDVAVFEVVLQMLLSQLQWSPSFASDLTGRLGPVPAPALGFGSGGRRRTGRLRRYPRVGAPRPSFQRALASASLVPWVCR